MNFEQKDYLDSADSMHDPKQIKKYLQSLLKDFKKTLDNTIDYKKVSSAYDLLVKASKFDAEQAVVRFYDRVSEYDLPQTLAAFMFSLSLHYALMDCCLEGEDFDPCFLEDFSNALQSGDQDPTLSEGGQESAAMFFIESMVLAHIAFCARAKSGISLEMINSLGNILMSSNIQEHVPCAMRTKNIRAKKGQIKYALAKNIENDLSVFVDRLSKSFDDPFEKAAYAVCEFTRIHPSVSKTGKIARALMTYCLQEAGLPPLLIMDTFKSEYDEALNSYTNEGLSVEQMRLFLRKAARICWQNDAFGILDFAEFNTFESDKQK